MLKRTYLKLVEMQEEQARRHLDEVRSIHSEMRGYKHDFHHHLQALKGQLEAGQTQRAVAGLVPHPVMPPGDLAARLVQCLPLA